MIGKLEERTSGNTGWRLRETLPSVKSEELTRWVIVRCQTDLTRERTRRIDKVTTMISLEFY